MFISLNPYYSGIYTSTIHLKSINGTYTVVLILIILEYTLLLSGTVETTDNLNVLILIILEYTLLQWLRNHSSNLRKVLILIILEYTLLRC
mgnify:CR=1 FL=1